MNYVPFYAKYDDLEEHIVYADAVEINKELNGDYSISFVTYNYPDNHAYALLIEEELVIVGETQFRIKQVVEYSDRKEIYAQHIFFDLITVRRNRSYTGNRTVEQFLEFIFEDTGWVASANFEGQRIIDNYGNDNVIKLTNGFIGAFECDFYINDDMSVEFVKDVKIDNEFQYRYGLNVIALAKHVDTSNLRTVIRGYGKDDLEVVYYSPNVEEFGELEADPVSDERFSIKENFLEYVKEKLIDYPEMWVELDTIEFEDKEVGEYVWLIYEPLNIEFQTRVLSKKSTIRNGELVTTSVIIGNTIPRTVSDVVDDIVEEVEKDKVINRSKFEQTDERITMEVHRIEEGVSDEIAKLNIQAGEILGQVTAVKTYVDEQVGEVQSESESNFRILSNAITSSVTESKEYVDKNLVGVREEMSSDFNVLAGRITAKADSSVVDALGRQLTSVEFDIDGLSGQISSKVSQSDYNGETMMSYINQTAGAVTILANKIQLNGITNVNEELTIGTGFGSSAGLSFNGTAISLRAFGDTLNMDASYIEMNAYTSFNRNVDFSNATVTGLSVPYADNAGYANNAGNASSVGGISGSSLLRAYLSHQGGSTFEFTGSQMIVRTPSGTTLRFNAN